MAQKRPCDVSPQSDQDKYSIALINKAGEWYGLDVPLPQIYPSTTNAPAPVERLNFLSYHGGRGYDKYIPKQFGFYDAYNGWSTTPGKFHATLQQRWARGLRNADFAMPETARVNWKKLIGNQSKIAVSFSASATYTAATLIVMIRKAVPAGTVGTPNDLTVALYSDSGGSPDTLLDSATLDPDDIDVTSQYYPFEISVALTSGTTYWVVVSASAADKPNACWEVATDPTGTGKTSPLITSWSAASFSPYYRVTDNDKNRQNKPFVFDGAFYVVTISDDGTTAGKIYLNGNRGRATGAQTSTTLKDTSHGAYGATNWPTDRFVGSNVRVIRGTGRGQVRRITANTDDTLTVSPAWDITPVAASSEYVIYNSDWFVEIVSAATGVLTDRPLVQNGIAYFARGDSTAMRTMKIDYTDADVHVFDNQTSNTAYFIENGFDTSKNEPVIWRAKNSNVAVSRASTAPNGTPVAYTTDLTFGASILVGDNTNLITGLQEHEGALYAFKEDGMFVVSNDRAVRVRMGVEVTPDPDNGRASVVAGDKQMYVAFRNDVYLVTGGGAYSTGLKVNLPSERSGPVHSLIAAEGWVFAAVNGGYDNVSSVMKFSLDTKTWSEQLRGIATGYRIRNLHWQPCPEARNRLWIDCEGDMMFQRFPLNGVRPFDDKTIKYEHEGVLVLPTIDLNSTDPKYFAVLTVTSQGLATDEDTETGHLIVVEVQTDNDIGTENWEHVDVIKVSPTASVSIDRGSRRMLRTRLRLITKEPTDPVILETVSVSLFTRNKLAHEWSMQFPLIPDDDEQNSVDLLMWLRNAAQTAEPLFMKSRFTLFHDRQVTLADEPRYQLTELDQVNNELEAQIWIKLTEVI